VALIVGAVLAAGSGSRMGAPKADLVVAGRRLLDRAVTVLRDGGCDPIIAVVRAGTAVGGVRAVVNPDPARGMRSSLALAVQAATLARADALAVLLVDTPGVGAVAVRTVVEAWQPGRIAVAGYQGRRGHPTVMAPELWRDAVAIAAPDEGARALLAARPELVDEIDVSGDPTDLDTPDDIRRWGRAHPG
jgi:molybdenum cofactor cytidylyltransferase/nicotine blue oxidoreductase